MNLIPLRLTAEAFLDYGEVVSTSSARAVFAVNDGRAQRFAQLANQKNYPPALTQEVSLYRVSPSSLPLSVSYFERHPLSSQLFYPLCATRYLVVVCPSTVDDQPDASRVQAWVADAGIGINYHAGVWHYPLVALDQGGDFLMLMAQSGGIQDCEIAKLAASFSVGA